MMTNGEKYKTAQERAEAFDKYCDGKDCRKCRLEMYNPDNTGSSVCALYWLDLEADAERIWKLQKENAELRECLKEVVDQYKCTNSKCEGCSCLSCWIKKAIAALEGVNHAND